MKFASAMAIERSSRAASRPRRTGTSGCGSTLAVSTSEELSEASIPCSDGKKTQGHAMRTSTTSLAYPFPLKVVPGSGRTAGRSGSRVGGHCER